MLHRPQWWRSVEAGVSRLVIALGACPWLLPWTHTEETRGGLEPEASSTFMASIRQATSAHEVTVPMLHKLSQHHHEPETLFKHRNL